VATQAWCWLEWGIYGAGQSLAAASSGFRVADSDSISAVPRSWLLALDQPPTPPL